MIRPKSFYFYIPQITKFYMHPLRVFTNNKEVITLLSLTNVFFSVSMLVAIFITTDGRTLAALS